MSAAQARDPEAARPVITYRDASARYQGASAAIERFDELDYRHRMVRAEAPLKPLGECDPAKVGPEGKYQPLTVADRLELIATGEVLARYYRHPAHAECALNAGATRAQIAAAAGTEEATARQAYNARAEGQHRLWQHCDGKLGMDTAEHAAAMRTAAEPGTEAGR